VLVGISGLFEETELSGSVLDCTGESVRVDIEEIVLVDQRESEEVDLAGVGRRNGIVIMASSLQRPLKVHLKQRNPGILHRSATVLVVDFDEGLPKVVMMSEMSTEVHRDGL